jgi:hypothetical protein
MSLWQAFEFWVLEVDSTLCQHLYIGLTLIRDPLPTWERKSSSDN